MPSDNAWPWPGPHPSDAYAASVAYFEHSLDGVLFSAPDGRILDANAAACELLARSKDDICTSGRAGLADPLDSRWIAAVAERRRSGRFVGPLSFVRGDGTTIELNLSSVIFADAEGELRSVVVLRESERASTGAAPDHDPALIDSSGVSNRPAFVHLAEQQCRHGARSRIALGFVYIHLERLDEHGEPVAPTANDRRECAKLLEADRHWGDVIGRVGEDDFAVLTRNDTGDVSALIRALYARLDARKRARYTPLHLHVGVQSFVSDASTSIVGMIDDAAARMDEHLRTDRDDHTGGSSRCFFTLDAAGEPAPPDILVPDEQPGLTEREHAVLRLLASRRSYEEIALALFVSVNTVKTHVSHAYAKLGVNTRKDAVERAAALGLLADRRLDGANAGVPADTDPIDFGRITLVAEALTAARDADEVLDIIVMQGLAGLDADRALVALDVEGTLVPVASYGYTDASIGRFLPAALDANLPLSVAVREQTIVWVASPEEGRRRFPEMRDLWPEQPRSWINAPLIAQGRSYGGFAATFLGGRTFSHSHQTYLRSLTNLAALALRNQHSRALHA